MQLISHTSLQFSLLPFFYWRISGFCYKETILYEGIHWQRSRHFISKNSSIVWNSSFTSCFWNRNLNLQFCQRLLNDILLHSFHYFSSLFWLWSFNARRVLMALFLYKYNVPLLILLVLQEMLYYEFGFYVFMWGSINRQYLSTEIKNLISDVTTSPKMLEIWSYRELSLRTFWQPYIISGKPW